MSLEKSCEDVELALLAGQSDLADFQLHNFDDDTSQINRIIVKAEPAEPALLAFDGVTVAQWMVPVSVHIRLMAKDSALMETLIAAVNAANNTDTPPAAAVTLAQSSFSGGPRIENSPDGGERETEDRARNFTTRFVFYVSP